MTVYDFRKTKAGMTLVEMVLSLLVLSILMTSTMGMVISSTNLFVSTSNSALDKNVGNSICDLLVRVFRYSTHLTIRDADDVPAANSSQQLYLTVTDEENNAGIIKYKSAEADAATNLYSDSFYGIGGYKRTVNYTIEEVGNSHQHIKITVYVYREGKLVYKRSEVIKCVNLALITTGANKNTINDQSSGDSGNQCLVFSSDEQLVAGGSDAYSLEYNLSEYLAKYNQIQRNYVADLNKALAQISGDYDADPAGGTVPGLRGTQNATGNRMSQAVYIQRIQKYYDIIFGDGSNTYEYDANDITKCKNLRAYYQEQIKDLLKFTPTAAEYVEGATKINNLPSVNDPSKKLTYNTHTGDPFYGVVATKEEIYTGFMLKNYDDDGNGSISKDEFPAFADPDTFFSGTSIASYLDQTSNSVENKMVVLAYCVDNVTDDNDDTTNQEYKPQLQTTVNENVFATDGTQSTMVASTLADSVSSGYHLVNNDGVKYIAKDSVSVPESQFISFTECRYTTNTGNRPFYTWNGTATQKDYVYYSSRVNYIRSDDFYQMTYNNKIYSYDVVYTTCLSDYDELTGSYGNNGVPAKVAYNDFVSRSGISLTNLDGKVGSFTQTGNLQNKTLTMTATQNLTEGWYMYKYKAQANDHYETWMVFYLKGSDKLVDVANNGVITESATDNAVSTKVAVLKGDQITIKFGNSTQITQVTYGQAQYHKGDSGATYTIPTEFTTYYAHQYVDYSMYGVDWNSWFSNTQTGLINKLLTGTVSFVQRLFGRDYSTEITSISGSNAVKSLGNTGMYNVNGFSTSTSSYNMAYCVYVPSTGTWYYLPSGSTRLSNAVSSISFTSSKDQPTPIDVELGNGDTWYNSTAMSYDIKNRKMTSSGLFGLIDTTQDQNWVSLPTGNQSNVNIDD